jgi:hypothetical protein
MAESPLSCHLGMGLAFGLDLQVDDLTPPACMNHFPNRSEMIRLGAAVDSVLGLSLEVDLIDSLALEPVLLGLTTCFAPQTDFAAPWVLLVMENL